MTTAPAVRHAAGARRGLARLLVMLGLGNTAMFMFYAGVVSILLPIQVAQLDPTNKVTSLGLVTGASAVFATLFNPIGGALSDRTRTRFGRRNPWLLGGAAGALGFAVLLGSASALWLVLVAWCLAQAMANVYQAAITATVPDRVAPERRGSASAMVGMAQAIGLVGGALLAARFVGALEWGYIALGTVLLAAGSAFAAITYDPRGEQLPPRDAAEPVRPLRMLGNFVSALRTADFAWAFTARAAMMMGYFLVVGYLLYTLTDYIGLPSGMAGADAVTILMAASAGGTVLLTAIAGPLSDRLARRKLFVFLSAVVAAAAALIPLLWPTWPAMIVFSIITGAAFGCFMAVDTAIVTLVLPRAEDNARDMGVLNIANAGPQIIAPFVAALVISNLGGYPPLFICSGALSLLGAIAIVPVRKVR